MPRDADWFDATVRALKPYLATLERFISYARLMDQRDGYYYAASHDAPSIEELWCTLCEQRNEAMRALKGAASLDAQGRFDQPEMPAEARAADEALSMLHTTQTLDRVDRDGRSYVDGDPASVTPSEFRILCSRLEKLENGHAWLFVAHRDGLSRKGRKSSPLDNIRPKSWTRQFTTELLELLWVLEATIAGYPEQEALLDRVLAGELFAAYEFPEVPDEARKPPKVPRGNAEGLFDD